MPDSQDPQEISDEALVAEAVQDTSKFAVLYERYDAKLYRYVRYCVDNAMAAEDIVADVFEAALKGLGNFSPSKGSFAGWFFGIARNATNRHLRAVMLHRIVSLEDLKRSANSRSSASEVGLEQEDQAELLHALQQLNKRQREIIGLKFGAEMSNIEIAEALGLSVSNVGVLLFRSMKMLRAELKAKGWVSRVERAS